jgi:hypothetical protein
LTWYSTFLQTTAKQLRDWKTSGAGTGIHWPALDNHLSVDGLSPGAPEAEGVTRLTVRFCFLPPSPAGTLGPT